MRKNNESFEDYIKRVERKEMIRNLLTFIILMSFVLIMFLIYK